MKVLKNSLRTANLIPRVPKEAILLADYREIGLFLRTPEAGKDMSGTLGHNKSSSPRRSLCNRKLRVFHPKGS